MISGKHVTLSFCAGIIFLCTRRLLYSPSSIRAKYCSTQETYYVPCFEWQQNLPHIYFATFPDAVELEILSFAFLAIIDLTRISLGSRLLIFVVWGFQFALACSNCSLFCQGSKGNKTMQRSPLVGIKSSLFVRMLFYV